MPPTRVMPAVPGSAVPGPTVPGSAVPGTRERAASRPDLDQTAAVPRPRPVRPAHVPAPYPAARVDDSGIVPGGTRGPLPVARIWPRVTAVLLAVLAVAGFVATWRVLVGTQAGQELEQSVLTGAYYGRGTLWRVAEPVLDVVSVSFVVLGMGTAMFIALLRRRWGLALQVAALVGGANVTTQLLKYRVLERPDLGVTSEVTANTLPSGHTTVAASVSIALLLVVPRRLRPLVAVLGAGYTAATGLGTLIGRWHRPSDVIAAVLVVLVWTALVCACTPRSGLDRDGRRTAASTAVGAAALLLVAVAAAGAGYAVLTGSSVPLVAEATASSEDVRAYVGMSAMVLAATAGAFAAALVVRQTTAVGVPRERRSA